MLEENKILVGVNDIAERQYLNLKMANRHGLIAGATGTGKTVTLRVLAESFSKAGVPVFLSDVKGDIAGISRAGERSEGIEKRLKKLGISDTEFDCEGFPVNYFDLYGKTGYSLHTTVEQLGAPLMAKILDLNETQSSLLAITYKVAKDYDLSLGTLSDLKQVLNFMSENRQKLAIEYGNISIQSVASIVRAIVNLELNGGSEFFQEKASDIKDLFKTDERGYGVINLLDSRVLISNGSLYSVFLLWIIDRLFAELPENGDAEKPKIVFFFDEAHLLFDGMPKVLLTKIEQTVKLIRSKGVGIYFVTQNPRDIPDGILSQLGNKVEHALRAYTPMDQKALKAAAESFRENARFDTKETIESLGIGEAIVSFLDGKGVPSKAERVMIVPPQSLLGMVPDEERISSIPLEREEVHESTKVEVQTVTKVEVVKSEPKEDVHKEEPKKEEVIKVTPEVIPKEEEAEDDYQYDTVGKQLGHALGLQFLRFIGCA